MKRFYIFSKISFFSCGYSDFPHSQISPRTLIFRILRFPRVLWFSAFSDFPAYSDFLHSQISPHTLIFRILRFPRVLWFSHVIWLSSIHRFSREHDFSMYSDFSCTQIFPRTQIFLCKLLWFARVPWFSHVQYSDFPVYSDFPMYSTLIFPCTLIFLALQKTLYPTHPTVKGKTNLMRYTICFTCILYKGRQTGIPYASPVYCIREDKPYEVYHMLHLYKAQTVAYSLCLASGD